MNNKIINIKVKAIVKEFIINSAMVEIKQHKDTFEASSYQGYLNEVNSKPLLYFY